MTKMSRPLDASLLIAAPSQHQAQRATAPHTTFGFLGSPPPADHLLRKNHQRYHHTNFITQSHMQTSQDVTPCARTKRAN